MASVRQKYPVAEQDLHAFVDGKLDGESYRTVIAYLSTSPEARERIIGFLRQQGNLAALREQLSDIDPLPDKQMKALVQSLAGTLRYQRRAPSCARAWPGTTVPSGDPRSIPSS